MVEVYEETYKDENNVSLPSLRQVYLNFPVVFLVGARMLESKLLSA
jgi:hypothetical protein